MVSDEFGAETNPLVRCHVDERSGSVPPHPSHFISHLILSTLSNHTAYRPACHTCKTHDLHIFSLASRAYQTPYGHATRRPPRAQHLPNAPLARQASCAPQSGQSVALADGGAQFDKKRRQSDGDKKSVVPATDAVTSIDAFPASMASERWWFASLAWVIP